MKMDISVSLRQVVAALNGVEVRGEENMDRLLGSIQALKSLVMQLEQEASQEAAQKPP